MMSVMSMYLPQYAVHVHKKKTKTNCNFQCAFSSFSCANASAKSILPLFKNHPNSIRRKGKKSSNEKNRAEDERWGVHQNRNFQKGFPVDHEFGYHEYKKNN